MLVKSFNSVFEMDIYLEILCGVIIQNKQLLSLRIGIYSLSLSLHKFILSLSLSVSLFLSLSLSLSSFAFCYQFFEGKKYIYFICIYM